MCSQSGELAGSEAIVGGQKSWRSNESWYSESAAHAWPGWIMDPPDAKALAGEHGCGAVFPCPATGCRSRSVVNSVCESFRVTWTAASACRSCNAIERSLVPHRPCPTRRQSQRPHRSRLVLPQALRNEASYRKTFRSTSRARCGRGSSLTLDVSAPVRQFTWCDISREDGESIRQAGLLW